MKKVIALIFILLMLLFSVSGCRSVSQKVAEKVVEEAVEKAAESEGEDVEVDYGEAKLLLGKKRNFRMGFLAKCRLTLIYR